MIKRSIALAVLATLAGALREWLLTRGESVKPSSTVRALVPMSMRVTDPSQAGAVGSRVGSILVDLPLHRLSDEPTHEGYNVYLSRPLALVAQDLDSGVLGRAQSAHARHILFVGDRFRVGIPETLGSNPVLGVFAGYGDVSRAGETNRPPVQLGVSVARPVLNLRPQLEADDFVKISTTIDSSAPSYSMSMELLNCSSGSSRFVSWLNFAVISSDEVIGLTRSSTIQI